MNEEQLEMKRKFAGEKVPSMHRRKRDFDYSGRRMYMVTMAVEGRHPLFGKVVGDVKAEYGSKDAPHIELSPLGEAVSKCWYEIEERSPGDRHCGTADDAGSLPWDSLREGEDGETRRDCTAWIQVWLQQGI